MGSRGMLYSFFNLGGRRGRVSNVTPRPLYLRERPGTHRRLGSASEPVWNGAKNLAPLGFDPRTVQPVASRYTD